MDPNPKKFPILYHVISRLPQRGSKSTSDSDPSSSHYDIEQPPSPLQTDSNLIAEMPHLNNPNIISSMTLAISDVSQTRSILQVLGDRPDHETIDHAILKISEIDSRLGKQLEEIVLSPRPPDVDRLQWRAHLAEKEQELRVAAEKEKKAYKDIVQLDEMHEAYEKLLKDAENRLIKIYDYAASCADIEEESPQFLTEEVNEDVVCVLQEASRKGVEIVDLSGRHLRILPEAFGRLRELVIFNLSSNLLQAIPDSIAGLEKLEELYLSSNLLESLPDSIGLLHNLKVLDVSGNKLTILPNSICNCRSLIELDASFNCLSYLPTNIGHELAHLTRLSIQLNKIRSLPSSISEMRSLRILDAHFNELRALPPSIGELTNLEILNLSSNFSDLTELPNSIGDLTNLRELDLSNNQIHALPYTFGRLENLRKLKIDQNPLVVPPKEVAELGVEAVKDFMAKKWVEILVGEEEKSVMEMKDDGGGGWVLRGVSWLGNVVSENVAGYLGSPRNRSPRDPILDQQL